MVLKTSDPKGLFRWLNFAAWVAAVKPGKVDIRSTTLAHMPTYLSQPRNTVSAWVLWEPDSKTALDVQDICLGKKLWKESEGNRRARRRLCQPGLWWRWGEGCWEGEEEEAEETVKLRKAQRAILGGFKQKPLPGEKVYSYKDHKWCLCHTQPWLGHSQRKWPWG